MTAYQLAHKNVSGEVIDGELIIVDLLRGAYFNSLGAGTLLWQAVEAGADMDEAIAVLAARADDATAFADAASTWIARLVAEQVLVPADGAPPVNAASFLAATQGPLELPVLERHGDLEDVLMFDPIHDFDELGWPVPPAS